MLQIESSSILSMHSVTIHPMTLGERIDLRLSELKEAGKSVAGLAGACGVTPSAVYQWINGDSKGLKPENLVTAAGYLQTHCQWLVFERGPKDRRMRAPDLSEVEQVLVESFRALTPEEARVFLQTVTNLANRSGKRKKGKGV